MGEQSKKKHPDFRTKLPGQTGANNSYQERKRVLTEDADCIIALPGGPGTWDELWEIVCLKGLGLTNLPICIIDVDNFYEGFQIQLRRAHADKLLYRHPGELLHFESRPEATLPVPMQRVAEIYFSKREREEHVRKMGPRRRLVALGTAAIALSIGVAIWRTRTGFA